VNLKLAAPEFGANWLRCRLVKLERQAEDGATRPARPLTATPGRGLPRRGFSFGTPGRPTQFYATPTDPTDAPRACRGGWGYVYFKEVQWTERLT
jgi:hypothetical protein